MSNARSYEGDPGMTRRGSLGLRHRHLASVLILGVAGGVSGTAAVASDSTAFEAGAQAVAVPAPDADSFPPFTSISSMPAAVPVEETAATDSTAEIPDDEALKQSAAEDPSQDRDNGEKSDPSPCKGMPKNRDDWLELVRSGIEYSICASSYRVDSFFGNREEEEIVEAEEVYGRLRLGTYWDEEKGFDPEFRLIATYPLPRLERRARAVVGRGTDEELIEGAPREVTQAQALSGDDEDVNWLLGLGIDRIRSRNSRLSFGAGIKLQNPINPYVKATYRYYKPVTDDFMLRFQQVVYWEYEDGLGATTRADAEWLLNEGRILRWGNYFKIHDNTDGLAWNTNLSLYQRIGHGRAIALRGLVRGETGKDVHPTKYQLVTIYRQQFLRDWLFFELYGGASWVRRELEDPREFVPELGLVFEIVFGDHPMLGD